MSSLSLGPLIGGLTDTRANLWARADGPATLHAWIGTHPDFSDAAPAGPPAPLLTEPFTGVVPLSDLQPDTRYYYALTLNETPPSQPDGAFTTLPTPGAKYDFAFAFGSCFRNVAPDSGQTFRALGAQRERDNLRLLLQIGDQIYADQGGYNRLGRAAINTQDYRDVYLHNWANPHYRQMLRNLPVYMTLDDHEIDNDWSWDSTARRWGHMPPYQAFLRWLKRRPKDELTLTIHRVRDAMQAYWEHQGMHASGYIQLPRMDAAGRFVFQEDFEGTLAYTFEVGAAAFIVLDTRTMRVNGPEGRFMLGEAQWQALEHWLVEKRETAAVKFVVTSSTLLYDMLVDYSRDRWGGYARERNRLLYFLAANGIQNVYFLAGDIHSAHAIHADLYGPNGSDLRIWEFCSSPFEQQTNPATWTYVPVFSGAIKRQKMHWVLPQHNYGVVRVAYDPNGQAQVSFEVYGERGELLKTIRAG